MVTVHVVRVKLIKLCKFNSFVTTENPIVNLTQNIRMIVERDTKKKTLHDFVFLQYNWQCFFPESYSLDNDNSLRDFFFFKQEDVTDLIFKVMYQYG